jgi:hypothetical protein
MTMTETLLRRGWQKGFKKAFKQGFEEGREESREETLRANLIKLLRLRFDALPWPVLPRIREADFAQMDHWFERGATAQTLAAVFSDTR